jgi:REP element-mobilizing transposase RayT
MTSKRISKNNNSGYYFVTLTVKHWYYLFDRHNRWNILADSLNYCTTYKKLKVFAFIFMLNHIHLVFSSPDAIGFIRDFKKFTSKELKKNIEQKEPNILKLFIDPDGNYHFWQPTNMPLLIESETFLKQKIEYIHRNPVEKKYVTNPQSWYWSSANPNSEVKISSWI